MNNLKELISKIIDVEWKMFSSVNASENAECQQDQKTFRIMRWMSYSVLDTETLKAIYENLLIADDQSRNLMTEKYARMENKIPVINDNVLINKIVEAEKNWMIEVSDKYPLTFSKNPAGFESYISCELETYSNLALECYYTLVEKTIDQKKKLVEERYNNLFKKMGYSSLADKESEEKAKTFWANNTCRGC